MTDQREKRQDRRTLLLRVEEPLPLRVWAVAEYDPRTDPWSLRLLASGGLSSGPATPLRPGCYWTIARDLLAAGLRAPAGCRSQMEVAPGPNGTVRLIHGATVAYTRAAPLTAFLGETYALVPTGAESRCITAEEMAAALPAA